MSTRDVLNRLRNDGQILHVPPQIPGASELRHVFLEATLGKRLLSSISGRSPHSQRLAALLQDVDQFVSGKFISIGDQPFDKDNAAFMARTSPVEAGIFGIRSRNKPAQRVFGAFTETDTFVGLTLRVRKELKNDALFSDAIVEALLVWNRLFPNHQPFVRANLKEHVSQNVHLV